MVRIVSIIAAIGFVGALIPVLVIVIVQGGSAATGIDDQISEARALTEERPRDAAAWDDLAQLLVQADRPDEAIAPAERAVRLGPRNAAYLQTLADALLLSGRVDRAVTAAQTFTKQNPRNAEGFVLLGDLALRASPPKTQLAVLSYQTAARLDPAGEGESRLQELLAAAAPTTPDANARAPKTTPVTP